MISLTLANKITIARILTIPFFVTALLYYSPTREYFRYIALGLFVFAAVSDYFDGYVARSRGQVTEIGKFLDPLADKMLVVCAFIFLSMIGTQFPRMSFPVWLVVTVISRDVVLVSGTVLIFLFHGHFRMAVSVWGKAATVFQMLCVGGLLLQWVWTKVFWLTAFVLTVISGLDYLFKGFYLMNTAEENRS